MKPSRLIERNLNPNFYKKLISDFFEEVADDIKKLRYKNPHYNNATSRLNYLYQDSDWFNEELLMEVKKMTAKKYKEKYCPTSLFDYFYQSEKANYIMLRVEIDKLLDIKGTFYKI